MSAALKLRLPGLVFHVRLGMDCVHGLPVYRGARTLYASNLWGMTQTQLTNAEEGFLVGEEGLLREAAHLQSLGTIITTETKNISKPCACVNVCPCVLAWGTCGHTHVEARDCHYTHSPITLHLKCWVLVSHWMTGLPSLVSPLAMGISYLHCPNSGITSELPILHPCEYQRSDFEPQFKASSSQDVCLLLTGVSSRKMLLIHYAVQRNSF